jgi:peptide subunit release factor 1 (eRF1)
MTMLRPETIEHLARFDAGREKVLSVYLDLQPERRLRRAWAIALEDHVRELSRDLDKDERARLSEEAQRVAAWVDGTRISGQGVAVFACTPGHLWEPYVLPDRVGDIAAWQRMPHLEPFLAIVDRHERFVVAVVDKRRARLFDVFMGQIELREEFEDDVPGKTDTGGPAQARIQRHHEDHVMRHLNRVVAELEALDERDQFKRLVIAGPEEATSALCDRLPKPLARRVAAVARFETAASPAEVLEMTLEVERRIRQEAEIGLVEDVIERAVVHGLGACGTAPTVDAVGLGEVATLVLADAPPAPGSLCPVCGWLGLGTMTTCPVCGAALDPVADIADLLTRRALDRGGQVEVVHGEAANRLATECDGTGAILRFRATTEDAPITGPAVAASGGGTSRHLNR